MTNIGELAQIVGATAAVLAALLSLRNQTKISEVHIAINSRMDQLLASVGAASRAAGVVEGKASAGAAAATKKIAVDARTAEDKIVHDAGVSEGQSSKLIALTGCLILADLITRQLGWR